MSSSITRRQALRDMGVAATFLALPGNFLRNTGKRHIITLSWDDGFRKSSIQTAQLYEKHGLPACINVIATGHLMDFQSPDEYQVTEKGDFTLWNDLKARGHEIMPHGYKHAHLNELPFEEAADLITKCLDYFTENLKGFRKEEAIFNFPYNASTPELEAFLMKEVLAFRTAGGSVNAMPHRGQQRLTCGGHGPENCEEALDQEISNLLAMDSGWLIYNVHGLDGEGWGPMRASYLDDLLGRLSSMDSVAQLPTGMALQRAG